MTINFVTNAVVVAEMNNYVEITVGKDRTKLFGGTPSVIRTGDALGEATATIKIRANTATRGEDFVVRVEDNTIRWKDGETGPKTVAHLLLVVPDTKQEPPEKLSFYIESVTNESIGNPRTMEVYIIDEPTVSINTGNSLP